MQNLKSYDRFFVLAHPKSPDFWKIELAQNRYISFFWGAENEYEVYLRICQKLKGGSAWHPLVKSRKKNFPFADCK